MIKDEAKTSLIILIILLILYVSLLESRIYTLTKNIITLQETVMLLKLTESSDIMHTDKDFFISVDPKQNWIRIKTNPKYLKFSTGEKL